MDAFYEESAVNQNAKKGARRYQTAHILSIVFIVIAILFLMVCLLTIQFGTPGANATADQINAYQMTKFICRFCGIQGVLFLVLWFILRKLKMGLNVSYDYCFVSC